MKEVPLRICVIDDEPEHLRSIEALLREVFPTAARQTGTPFDPDAVVISLFDNVLDVLKLIESSAKASDGFQYDLVIADVFMPYEPGGREHPHHGAVRLYDALKAAGLQDRVVLLIVSKDVVHAEDELLRIDAEQRTLEVQWAFTLAKPKDLSMASGLIGITREAWTSTVAQLIAQRNNQEWRKRNFLRLPAGDIVGNSFFDGARRSVDQFADSGSLPFVLITGERGTGKDLIAKYVADRTGLGDGVRSFDLRLGAERTLAVRLFGQELPEPREGLLELEPDTVVFIDEFAIRSPSRHVLDDKLQELFNSASLRGRRDGAANFHRLDGVDAKKFCGTVILSCERFEDLERNRDVPPELVELLGTRKIDLPPLRGALPLIGPLARHFLQPGQRFEAGALRLLSAYTWPGNLKELEDAVVKASEIAKNKPDNDTWVTAQDLRQAGIDETLGNLTGRSGRLVPRWILLGFGWAFSLPHRAMSGTVRRVRRSPKLREFLAKVWIDLSAKVVSNLLLTALIAGVVGLLVWLGLHQ